MHAHAMTPPPPCFTDEDPCLGSFAVHFFSTFLLSHHLGQRFIFVSSAHKHSNLAFLCLVLVRGLHLAVHICNSVSKSAEDSRLSEHHRSFLEVVGDFTYTTFRVHFHSFFDSSVINYCWFLSRSGRCWCRWLFSNSWFLHALCFGYSFNWLPLFF